MDGGLETGRSVPANSSDIEKLSLEAQNRWLRPTEICHILWNYEKFGIASEPPNEPPSGSLFLFDRKVVRNFRRDGHNWQRKENGKLAKDGHKKLKIGGIEVLHCYYAHGEENKNFQRRCYSMIEKDFSNIVLVHYLETGKEEDSSCVKETEGANPYSQENEKIMPNSEIGGSLSSGSCPNNCPELSENTDTCLNSAQAVKRENARSEYNHKTRSGFHSGLELRHPAVENIDAGGSDPYVPPFNPNSFHEEFSSIRGIDLAPTQLDKGKSDNDSESTHDWSACFDFTPLIDAFESCTPYSESIKYQSLSSSSNPDTVDKVLSKSSDIGLHSQIGEESKSSVEDSSSLSKQPMDQKLYSDSACDITCKFHEQEVNHLELMNFVDPQQEHPDTRNDNFVDSGANSEKVVNENENDVSSIPFDEQLDFFVWGPSLSQEKCEERALGVHISSFNLDNQDDVGGGPKTVQNISEISTTALGLGNTSDALSLIDVGKFDAGKSDPYPHQSYSNCFRGKLSAVPGMDLASNQAGKGIYDSDSGLSYESQKHLDSPLQEDILENRTPEMESIQGCAFFSSTQSDTRGQFLSNNFLKKQEFGRQPGMQEECQMHSNVCIDNSMENDCQRKLSNRPYDYVLPSNSDGDLNMWGKSICPSAIRPHLLNGSLREEGLKKLDSFNPRMSEEIGDATDSGEPYMQYCAGLSLETVENENGIDVSSIPSEGKTNTFMLGPSLSQDQLFSIVDFSPNWTYVGSETEVLIRGRFLKSPDIIENCQWSCMFGEVEVPADVVADGVLRCYPPTHEPGWVHFYVTCSNRLVCSEVGEFEYRVSNSHDNYSSTSENILLRFDKLLTLSSSFNSLDTSSFDDGSELSSKINSLLKDDTLEWDEMSKFSSDEEYPSQKLEGGLHQKQLKEKLRVWLLQKVAEGGKGPSVLDEGGQGVLHFAAALGYGWAFEPTILVGVNVNFHDVNGWTALHWAAFCGRENTVASLISLDADPGALTDPSPEYPLRRTPADLASANGHKRIAVYLGKRPISSNNLDSHTSSFNLDHDDAVDMNGLIKCLRKDLKAQMSSLRRSEAAALAQMISLRRSKDRNHLIAQLEDMKCEKARLEDRNSWIARLEDIMGLIKRIRTVRNRPITKLKARNSLIAELEGMVNFELQRMVDSKFHGPNQGLHSMGKGKEEEEEEEEDDEGQEDDEGPKGNEGPEGDEGPEDDEGPEKEKEEGKKRGPDPALESGKAFKILKAHLACRALLTAYYNVQSMETIQMLVLAFVGALKIIGERKLSHIDDGFELSAIRVEGRKHRQN